MTQLSDESRRILDKCDDEDDIAARSYADNFPRRPERQVAYAHWLAGYNYAKCELKEEVIRSLLELVDAQAEVLKWCKEYIVLASPRSPLDSSLDEVLTKKTEVLKGLADGRV